MRGHVGIIKKTVIFIVLTCIVMLSVSSCTSKRILVIDDEGKAAVKGDGKTSYETGNDEPGEDTEVNGSVAPEENTEPGRLDIPDGSLQGFIFASCEDGAAYKLVEYNGSSSEITIPSEYNGKPVIEIGERAFENNIVNTVIISDGVKRIEEYAFYYCAALESVSVPDSVAYIGEAAFAQCHSLKSVEIGKGVISIDDNAFLHCRSLLDIKLPANIQYIGQGAFENTAYYNNAENWTNKALYIDTYLIEVQSDVSGKYTVKAGTTLIAACAFWSATNLTSIDLTADVIYICRSVLAHCTSLEEVYFGAASIDQTAFYRCINLKNVYYYSHTMDDIEAKKQTVKRISSLFEAEWHYAQ